MQQTLSGCGFCSVVHGANVGPNTKRKYERGTRETCVDCAVLARPGLDERDHHDSGRCELAVDALAALTQFRVEFSHLEGLLQPCAQYRSGGPTTYSTQDLRSCLTGE